VWAKHGVIGLTKTAALDYADHNPRVKARTPGPILTDNLRRAGAQAQAAAAAAMPMRQVGQPEEVAQAAVSLCCDQARFITGVHHRRDPAHRRRQARRHPQRSVSPSRNQPMSGDDRRSTTRLLPGTYTESLPPADATQVLSQDDGVRDTGEDGRTRADERL
jgi:hypothetical protein